jgi:hypothetical protein
VVDKPLLLVRVLPLGLEAQPRELRIQLGLLHHTDVDLGSGRIVASETEAPNMFANLV